MPSGKNITHWCSTKKQVVSAAYLAEQLACRSSGFPILAEGLPSLPGKKGEGGLIVSGLRALRTGGNYQIS